MLANRFSAYKNTCLPMQSSAGSHGALGVIAFSRDVVLKGVMASARKRVTKETSKPSVLTEGGRWGFVIVSLQITPTLFF